MSSDSNQKISTSRYLLVTRKTIFRATRKQFQSGKSCSRGRELRLRMYLSVKRLLVMKKECGVVRFSTTTPRRTGGAVQEYQKKCLQESREVPTRKFFTISELHTMRNLDKSV